jgi:hypothetical protein
LAGAGSGDERTGIMKDESNPSKEKWNWKDFFSMGEVGKYFFRSKDQERPSNINIKIMHGINRIAILVFLLGIIFLILKRIL